MPKTKTPRDPRIPEGTRCSRRAGGVERWDFGGHPCQYDAKTFDKDEKPICGIHAAADARSVTAFREERVQSAREEADRERAMDLRDRLSDYLGVQIRMTSERRTDSAGGWTYSLSMNLDSAESILKGD